MRIPDTALFIEAIWVRNTSKKYWLLFLAVFVDRGIYADIPPQSCESPYIGLFTHYSTVKLLDGYKNRLYLSLERYIRILLKGTWKPDAFSHIFTGDHLK